MRYLILMLFAVLLCVEPASAKKAYTLKNGVLRIHQDIPLTGIHTPWRKQRREIHSVIVEEGVTKIYTCTFFELFGVTAIYLPSTLRSFDATLTLVSCDKLQKITVAPDNPYIKDIDGKILYTKDNTTLIAAIPSTDGHLTLPENLTTISDCALSGTLITGVDFPETLKSIGFSAFRGCPNLKEVHIPSSVENIGVYAFDHCNNLETIELREGIKSIEASAFNATNIEEVVLPSSVNHIERSAFRSTRLRKVVFNSEKCTIDNKEKHLNTGKIFNSAKLDELVIGPNVKEIPNSFLGGNTNFKELIIPSTVVRIGSQALSGIHGLRRIVIPDGIKEIPNGLFENCTELQEVVIPSTVSSIGNRAFYGCKSLKQVSIPVSVTSIGNWAFADCDSLSEVEIPANVTEIGEDAFNRCKSLASVKMNAVKCKARRIFNGCSKLENISFDDNVKLIPEGFCEKLPIRSITLPSALEEIADFAFNECKLLEKIDLPDGLLKIGDAAFSHCEKLEYIVIPKSVTYMGGHAIRGIENMRSVKILNPDMETSKVYKVLRDLPNCTLIIPKGSSANFDPILFDVKGIVEK